MWFTKLIKQFFFWIDKIVYNFIPEIYDLMLEIARTSILTQADIVNMAERVYKLIAIFMVFKVTLSLITYVVNPDDFSDKSKGVAKLGTNIVISLSLLILTPYIFNYAYQLQTIILEDNSLAALVFGDDLGEESFLNSAGDQMSYITMQAFFSPNLSLNNLYECTTLYTYDKNDEKKFNPACSTAMSGLGVNETDLKNYITGVERSNLGLMFRQDLVLTVVNENDFLMDYKFIFSTVVGVVVILLLITFCIDVAVRSLKLAFLQLIAPIPILSYVDPKSGKDGLFKKWYEMCFKTFLSLFIRLLSLYFAIYVIQKVGKTKLVDIIDGSYKTGFLLYVFIIIGALMFAKQLPEILKGLGIKLDGDGKFTLNPLKKFEDGALGGKNITGMARGALVGTAGMLSGAGFMAGVSGAWNGLKSGKGWKEAGKATAEMNKKMRQAKLDGSSFGGRIGARFASATGFISGSEIIADRKNDIEKKQRINNDKIKSIEDHIAPTKKSISDQKKFSDAVKSMEDRAKGEIENGNSWVGEEYKQRKKVEELFSNNISKKIDREWTKRDVDYAEYRIKKAQKEKEIANEKGDAAALARAEEREREATLRREEAKRKIGTIEKDYTVTSSDAAWASSMKDDWINDEGMKNYMTDASSGVIDDATFRNARENAEKAGKTINVELSSNGGEIHGQYGKSKGETGRLQRSIHDDEQAIEDIKLKNAKLGDDLRELTERERTAKANETAIK